MDRKPDGILENIMPLPHVVGRGVKIAIGIN